MLAALPLRRAEEALTMVQHISAIVTRRCETVAASLKDWLLTEVWPYALYPMPYTL